MHHGLELRFDGAGHRIDLADADRRAHDHRLRPAGGGQGPDRRAPGCRRRRCASRSSDVSVHDLDGRRARRSASRHEGAEHELRCDVIAGCDGFHGICRDAIPAGVLTRLRARVPVRLARHPGRGRALHRGAHLLPPRPRLRAAQPCARPRSAGSTCRCEPDEDLDAWPDDRIWEELQTRLATDDGFRLDERPDLEKGITPMRSFVVEPMQHGRLFLAGDAAHIVPADRRQGPQPGGRRRARPRRGARRLVRGRRPSRPGRLLGHVPAAGLARAALLVVDDADAAPLRRRRPLRGPAAALAAATT